MIRQTIDANWPREVEFLKSLVRVASDNPPGDCAPHAEASASALEALGFAVERHPVPEALVRENGMISATNLIVRKTFGAGRGPVIALNAHGDVVPPGEGWTVNPYGAVEKDGALYGRGVAVSKSDFATYAFALLALETSPQPLDGGIELHFTYDEEAGGMIGPKWLIDQGLTKANYAISAGFSYGVTIAHNGCLHLEVVVRGRQAHAAMPATGSDALEAAVPVLAAIYGERKRLASILSSEKGIGSPQITVGLISGGINTNVVPDKVTIRLDRRITPEEDPAQVEAHLRLVIGRSVKDVAGISVSIERVLLASPLRQLPGADMLIEPLVKNATAILGVEPKVEGVPLYTDARLYAEAGIPTVSYGAGPRSFLEANGHRADERLELSDLDAATKIVALSLAEILAA
jgi:acetylornithine deacetylase/succinyl-diaminopimelate desuccinylase family protein